MRKHPRSWPIRLESDVQSKPIPELTNRQSENFWNKVDVHQPSGCWEWTGCKLPTGYGRLKLGVLTLYAHRVAYTILIGQIGDNLTVDHLCRNTCCVNPDHMQIVPISVNVQRRNPGPKKLRPARVPTVRKVNTHCKRGHELTEDNTKLESRGRRLCRTCDNERQRRNWALRRVRESIC